ncbi:MAG: hypothetical protein ACRD9R_08210 [Pyrinomonadaceae bacterium]
MGLSEIQQCLARLYTDAALRARFHVEPFAVGHEFGLTEGEAQQLSRLSAAQLDAFATSLVNKRLQEVADLLSLTRRASGARFAALFRDYAESCAPPHGVKKHLADALAFAGYLETLGRAGRLDPAWLTELARYERLRLRAFQPGRFLLVSRFRYDLVKLTRSLQPEDDPPAPGRRANILIRYRLSRNGGVKQRVVYL